MDSSNRTPTRDLPLEQLVAGALHHLEGLVYSRKSLWSYRAVWQQLTEFGWWSARLVSPKDFRTTAQPRPSDARMEKVMWRSIKPAPINSTAWVCNST